MGDSEQLPDDVPVDDVAEQLRPVRETNLDDEDSAETPTELPLEAAAADWQEQHETVEVDPDEFFPND